MSDSAILYLGGKPIPLDLHRVWADETGTPQSVGAGPIKFDFVCRGVRFAGFCDDEANALKLVGDLGPMPYTAESPSARLNLTTIFAAANDALGPCFRLSGGRILLGLDAVVRPPVDAVALIGAVAVALIPALPYLELVGMMVRPPMEKAPTGEPALRSAWRQGRKG